MTWTIDSQLAAAGGRPSGFDYMRLLLSIGVVAMHSFIVSYGTEGIELFWTSAGGVPFRFILPMFFALSGFLVMGSFERCRTLAMFFGLRVIRIWPALLVEVLLSALILGPIFTSWPLASYFSDPLFARYFLNMLGEPQYFLPGVFELNPYPGWVNAQLWTVPFELACYIVLGAVGAIGLRRHRVLAPAAVIGLTVVYLIYRLTWGQGVMAPVTRPLSGPLLVISFMVGVSAYLYRRELPASRLLGVGAVLLAGVLLTNAYTQLLAVWPLGYLTVYLGTLDPRRISVIKGADYSYGIFLYGFPIQQMLATSGVWAQNPLTNTVAATLIAAGFSAVSWRYIEAPALRLRAPMKRLEDRWLARRQPSFASL